MSIGVFAALGSAVFATSKDLVSKRVASRVDSTVSTCASFLYALPFYGVMLLVLWLTGRERFVISLAFWFLVVGRSVTDAFAEWFKMRSLSYGDISLVACFFSLSPVFLLITSPLITGDKLALSEVGSVFLIVAAGILLVYKPAAKPLGSPAIAALPQTVEQQSVDRNVLRAILYAIAASCFFSINSCFDRLAVQQASPVWSGFTMTAAAGLIFLPRILSVATYRRDIVLNWQMFSLRGLFEVIFMTLKLIALQYISAPYAVTLMRASILFTILGGGVLLHEADLKRRLLAGALTLMSVAIVVFEKI